MENFLFQSESKTSECAQINHPRQKSQQSIINKFILSENSTRFQKEQDNSIKAFVYFTLFSLHAFSFAIIQDLISKDAQNAVFQKFLQQFYGQKLLYWTVFIGSILLKVLLMMSIFVEMILSEKVVILSQLNKQCFNNFTLLKQLDLLISGLLVLVNWRENFAQLIVSGAITIFHAVYLQQYVNRRDLFYASSSTQFMFVRAFLFLSHLANALFLSLNNSSFLACYSLFGFALIVTWYLLRGHRLYIHQFSKTAFSIAISFFLTLYLVFVQCWINDVSLIQFSHMFKILLVFATLLLLLNTFLIKSEKSDNFQDEHLKTVELKLLRLFEESSSNKESCCLLTGILYYSLHVNNDINIDLFDGHIYDSYLKESVVQRNFYLQKESLLRNYIKHIYEKSLESDQNADIYLDYSQFLVNECNTIFNSMEIIAKAKRLSLDIIQTIRVLKMEQFLKKQHESMSLQLYNGKLEIQHIREAEDCFRLIEDKTYLYVQGNLNVWRNLQLQEIQLAELRISLTKEVKNIEQIKSLWKEISKFLMINKAWRLIYLNFLVFIQNEKIKQRQLDYFANDKEQSSIFNSQMIYFEESAPEDMLCNPAIMFNQNSCCLIAAYEQGQLSIKDVNNRFTNMLKYTKEEIQGASISVIMPPEIVDAHNQKFKEWVHSGLLSNQISYHPKFTSFVTKNKQQIPAVKYYKAYYHIDRGFQFVCLLKGNTKIKLFESQQCQNYSQIKVSGQSATIIKSSSLFRQFQQKQQTDFALRNNIFLKEEILQPNNTFAPINHFKLASRILTGMILIGIISLTGINNTLGTTLTSYSSQFITFMNMYRYPIILDINYMKLFLKIGNATKTNATITSNTALFLQNCNKVIARKTLFDTDLNVPDIYYPQNKQNFTNKANLSHIDLYQQMVSAISTLSYSTINRTSNQFRVFHAYVKPSYDQMMNKTKNSLKKTFDVLFSTAINEQYIFIISQSIIFILFVIIYLKFIQTSVTKTRNIISVLLDFDSNDVRQVNQYWKKVNRLFKSLFRQTHYQKISKKVSTSYLQLSERQNKKTSIMNKLSKNMKEDIQKSNLFKRLKILLVTIMLLMLILIMSIQLSQITTLKDLQTFEEDGFFFVKYFPIGPIVSKGCVQKYYSDQYPNEIKFSPKKYEDSLSTMRIFGSNNNYVSDTTDETSVYNTKRYNYFFGSPCQFNPSIILGLGASVDRCLKICNGTYKQGMSSYLRYAARLGDICINNKTNLTPAQIDQFTLGGTILSNYIIDAMATWTTEFAQKVTNMQDQGFIDCTIMVIILVVIHLLVKELKMIGFLESEYQFIKHIYLRFVPEFILMKEKVIRQKLVIEGIINN